MPCTTTPQDQSFKCHQGKCRRPARLRLASSCGESGGGRLHPSSEALLSKHGDARIQPSPCSKGRTKERRVRVRPKRCKGCVCPSVKPTALAKLYKYRSTRGRRVQHEHRCTPSPSGQEVSRMYHIRTRNRDAQVYSTSCEVTNIRYSVCTSRLQTRSGISSTGV